MLFEKLFHPSWRVASVSFSAANEQVVLTWHHLLHLFLVLVQSQVSYLAVGYWSKVHLFFSHPASLTTGVLAFVIYFVILHIVILFLILFLIIITENRCCVVWLCCVVVCLSFCVSLGKKAMLGFISHCASHGRDSTVDFMFNKEPMHRLAGSCSLSTGNCYYLVDLRIFLQHLHWWN